MITEMLSSLLLRNAAHLFAVGVSLDRKGEHMFVTDLGGYAIKARHALTFTAMIVFFLCNRCVNYLLWIKNHSNSYFYSQISKAFP
jgi:hypothetical protein